MSFDHPASRTIVPRRFLWCLAFMSALAAAEARAETLQEYVTACKTSLGITGDIPAMNCNDGVRFAYTPGGLINDFLGYQRINSYVDLTFACRWLTPLGDQGPFTAPASLELLIHNRQNGNTCFFAAKPTNSSDANGVSTAIVSPTNFNPIHDAMHPNADDYWRSPSDLRDYIPRTSNPDPNATLKCVGCHAAGPYIASPRIAPFLAQFGLLNNGHDDVAGTRRYHAVNSEVASSAFFGFDGIVDSYLNATPCASGCHAIAENSPVPTIIGKNGVSLIPSIQKDISDVLGQNLMPRNGSKLNDDYRWMNIDIPDDSMTTGDVETFYPLKKGAVGGFNPTLNAALACETEPAYMEARLVGTNVTVKSNEHTVANTGFPDVLEKFDQTGLICRNASQASQMCHNYAVRFVCLPDYVTVTNDWSQTALTIALPDANQIRWAKGQPYNTTWGPLSQKWQIRGVNDGANFNYVRFYNPWLGIYLNADDSLLVSTASLRDSWLSEQWVMEYVAGTTHVRFKNLWKTNIYLTMVDSSAYSSVNLQPLHTDGTGKPDWTSQEWDLTPSPN